MQAGTGKTERADGTACMGPIHTTWSFEVV